MASHLITLTRKELYGKVWSVQGAPASPHRQRRTLDYALGSWVFTLQQSLKVKMNQQWMRPYQTFNRTAFSKFLNRPAGRIFRLAAGSSFLVIGLLFRQKTLGLAAMIWSVFPITAGVFDVCYISAILGGPFSGAKIRETFGSR